MALYDKPATATWIRRRITLYAKRVSLGYRPRVVWTMPDWMALGAHKSDRACNGYKGLSSAELRAIRINLSAHICRHDADDTAAHEVVHLRWPSLRHTLVFERRVEAIRKGAKAGPHGARLPENLK